MKEKINLNNFVFPIFMQLLKILLHLNARILHRCVFLKCLTAKIVIELLNKLFIIHYFNKEKIYNSFSFLRFIKLCH